MSSLLSGHQPQISIILPAYNAAATIGKALDSLTQQSFQYWETLVIDDGSVDDTAAIAARHQQRDPRIKLITQTHKGIVEALNFGLAQAQAPFIARHDADDTSHPARLSKQLEHLNKNPDIGLSSSLVRHTAEEWANPEKDTRGYASYCEWLNSITTSEQIKRASFIESPLAHPTVMFRRELVEKFGGYRDGNFPEDYELWLRWLSHGVRMEKVPEALYTWTDRPSRLSRVDPRYEAEQFHRLKSQAIAAFLQDRKELIVWGAGVTSRKRAAYLEEHGCKILCYIDVDEKRRGQKIDGKAVWLLDEFDKLPLNKMIVSYVGARGAGQQVREFLEKRALVEERDFLICS